MRTLSRRQFAGTALSAAAGAPTAISSIGLWTTIAASPALGSAPRGPHVASSLTDNLTLLTGAGANVLAAKGPEGLLLVDGGLAKHSAQLLKVTYKHTGARQVHTLFNTHWHPEQTGSNERLGKRGTRIIAHENTRLWLGRAISVSWRERAYGPLPEKARPTETIYTTATLTWHDEPVEYGYMPQAHTDGDIYVFFRNANVLAAGGVVSGDGWPLIDWQTGGWIGGLVAGLNTLIRLADTSTRVVPANGPMLTRADLEAQRDMYMKIYERLVKSLTSGLGPDEALAAAPTKGLNEHWGDPSSFVIMAFKSLWGHFAPDA